jgi:anti-sigma factor RsiW
MDEKNVRAACAKHGATISAIEALQSGGTRVVLMSSAAAETMRKAFGKRVLTGQVQRAPLRTWSL